MTFNSALSGAQMTKLRSRGYQAAQFVSFFSNRVVFECQTNVDLTTTTSYASFAWTNTVSGAYTNVEVGQTILVSLTNDITKAIWRLRVRLAPNGTTIYCNETDAKIPNGSYVFVLDTFEVWDRLSRPDSSTPPVQLEDYDLTFQKLLPSITGLQYIYAGEKDTGTGKFRIALNLTGITVESGATISTWLITPRAGQATLISGSYSSAVATFDLDPSTMATWGETWFTVAVTDSNGLTLTRHSGVKITDATHPSDVDFESMQGSIDISADIARGWSARLPAFAGVDSILPWTLGVIWRAEEVYGGVSGALGATSNIDFVGYLRKDNPQAQGDTTYGVLSQTTFEMVDVAARLANIEMQLIGMFYDVAPTLWDHINNLTVRRGLWHVLTRHSTAPYLVDVTFDTQLSDDSFLFPILSTQGQNSLAVCNGIAAQVNAALEFGPDGVIQIYRDARYLTAAQRNALVTVATFNAQGSSDDCFVVSSDRTYEPRVGVIDANGAMSNPSGIPTVYQSRAPGMAQGISQGTTTLANQILVQTQTAANAQAELNQRAGNQFEVENNQETLTLEFPDGYNFFIPSHAQWYILIATTNLAGTNGVNRIIYDSSVRWLLETVRYSLKPAAGERKVTVTMRRESRIGDPGYTVIIPPQPTASILPFNFTPPAFPGLTITPILPPDGIINPPIDPVPTGVGFNVVEWGSTADYAASNYVSLATPLWAEKTPSDLGSFGVAQVIADLSDLTKKAAPAYLLASDGVNSAVWYTANIAQALPVWTKGANIAGVFKLIRLTNTPGEVAIYCPSSNGAGTIIYDFGVGSQGFVPQVLFSQTLGVYSGGAWNAVDFTGDGGTTYQNDVDIIKMIGSSVSVTSIIVVMDRVQGDIGAGDTRDAVIRGILSGVTQFTFSTIPGPFGTNITYIWSGSATIDEIQLDINQAHKNAPAPTGGSCAVKKVIVNGGGAIVAFSSNFGATWGAPLTVGSSPDIDAGFDAQHGGTVSFAASDQEINKASTLGGAYSNFLATTGGEPVLIEIPWYKWGQTIGGTKNTGSTPDFCYGTDVAVGGETFWLVVGSTATANSPVVSATKGTVVGPNCVTTWCGTRIAGLFKFSGVIHLMTGVITNTGTPAITWTDRGALNALYIRGGYKMGSPSSLFIAGPNGSWYSSDYGANVKTRTSAAVGNVLGIEPAG